MSKHILSECILTFYHISPYSASCPSSCEYIKTLWGEEFHLHRVHGRGWGRRFRGVGSRSYYLLYRQEEEIVVRCSLISGCTVERTRKRINVFQHNCEWYLQIYGDSSKFALTFPLNYEAPISSENFISASHVQVSSYIYSWWSLSNWCVLWWVGTFRSISRFALCILLA